MAALKHGSLDVQRRIGLPMLSGTLETPIVRCTEGDLLTEGS